MLRMRVAATLTVLGLCMPLLADEVIKPRGDDAHSRTWNAFVDHLYVLHKQQLEGREIRKQSTTGGYPRQPDFYDEVVYTDAANNRALSTIRWERKQSEGLMGKIAGVFSDKGSTDDVGRIHSIAVNVYDDTGRVIRDYLAAYLPEYRNAPTQTLIFLHAYHGDLHAYRSFDASGNRIFEECEGTHAGKQVDIRLDEDDLAEAEDDPGSVLNSETYKTCFAGLPVAAGEYLIPK